MRKWKTWSGRWRGPRWRRGGQGAEGGISMGFSKTTRGAGGTIAKIDGPLIAGHRQELKTLGQEGLDAGERRFLIDCSQTGYIDSSGLGALVSLTKKVRELGGEVRIPGLTQRL